MDIKDQFSIIADELNVKQVVQEIEVNGKPAQIIYTKESDTVNVRWKNG